MQAMIGISAHHELSARDILFLAQNPKELQKTLDAVEAKRAELAAQQAELDRRIAMVGKADEIEALHAEAKEHGGAAKADRAAAAEDLRRAADEAKRRLADADRSVADARRKAETIVSDGKAQASRVQAAADEAMEKAKRRALDLDERERALAEREAAVIRRERDAEASAAALEKDRTSHQQKVAAIAKAISAVG